MNPNSLLWTGSMEEIPTFSFAWMCSRCSRASGRLHRPGVLGLSLLLSRTSSKERHDDSPEDEQVEFSNEWFDTLPNEAFIGVLEHLYRVLKPMRHAYPLRG